MKKPLFILFLLALLIATTVGAVEGPRIIKGLLWSQDGTTLSPTDSSANVSIGDPVSETDVEKPLTEIEDLNGDIVASLTVECSDLTDESQDCTVYVYKALAGALTRTTLF
jgi:hypothetical protein